MLRVYHNEAHIHHLPCPNGHIMMISNLHLRFCSSLRNPVTSPVLLPPYPSRPAKRPHHPFNLSRQQTSRDLKYRQPVNISITPTHTPPNPGPGLGSPFEILARLFRSFTHRSVMIAIVAPPIALGMLPFDPHVTRRHRFRREWIRGFRHHGITFERHDAFNSHDLGRIG